MTEFPIHSRAEAIDWIVKERVGGFFHNTYPPGTAGICTVCRGPSTEDLCAPCLDNRKLYGSLLADRTVLLTYAQGNVPKGPHQSAHEVRAYKGYKGTPAVQQCRENLQLIIRVAIALHRKCLSKWLGAHWDSLTFVPSRERPGRNHPVAALANAVLPPEYDNSFALQKFLLHLGPGSEVKHKLVNDRFVVPDEWRAAVDGKHVLIVDDTWTTGSSAQGAAIAVKDADAASATVLCVDRWLRWDWPDHKRLIDSLANMPYQALRCPVDGSLCQQAAGYQFAPF